MSIPVSVRLPVPLRQAVVGALAGVFAFGGLLALIQPAEGRTRIYDSRYSRFDYQTCPEADSPEPGVIERHRCAGPGGIAVVWLAEPDSSEVSFGTSPDDESLPLDVVFEASDTIEWRIRTRAGESSTIAAILRYAHGPAIGRLAQSRLVVYRIEPTGRSCVIGSIDGGRTNANAEARQLADRWAAGFVCGSSSRR